MDYNTYYHIYLPLIGSHLSKSVTVKKSKPNFPKQRDKLKLNQRLSKTHDKLEKKNRALQFLKAHAETVSLPVQIIRQTDLTPDSVQLVPQLLPKCQSPLIFRRPNQPDNEPQCACFHEWKKEMMHALKICFSHQWKKVNVFCIS